MMNYIKVAFRLQTRYKWFTLINIAGLSLGIMCSIILFLYVNFHISTDSYHKNASRIYRLVLEIHTPNGSIEYEGGTVLPMAEALRKEYSQIEKTAFCMKFYRTPTITVTKNGKENKFKDDNVVAYADNNFIELFEHQFVVGDQQTALRSPQSVVLSEKQALKYFGSVHVLGHSVNINDQADLIVTGVIADLPINSDLKFDVIVSLPTLKVLNPNYQDQNFTWIGGNNWIFIELKDGVPSEDINNQLPSFVKKYLGTNFNHWDFHLQPLSDMHFDIRYGGVIKKVILWILAGVAIALICIVCINYINLSIAQSYHRTKEIGIRKCLGSSRAQLFLQFMFETGTIVFFSICIGLIASHQILPFINSWIQVDLVLLQLATPHKLVYFIFFGISLILLAGYYPAIILSGFDPLKAIAGRKGKIQGTNPFLRKSLICFQFVISLLFLISALVIVNQVDYLLKNDLGFSKEAIIIINTPRSNFSKLQTFRNEIGNIPGVEWASLHHRAPMSTDTDGGFVKYDQRTQWEDFIVRDRWADDQFINTYSLQIVAGRNIVLRDSVTEVVTNETFLRKLNMTDPNAALGKTILFDNSGITGTIVGVVRDFHHRSLQNEIEPLAIYPFPSVFSQVGVKFVVNQSERSLAGIKTVWKNNFPDETLDFSFLDQSISKMYRMEQTTGKMMRVFAGVSILICCMGILGLSVFSSLQRTKEIGIRKVLGATVWNIIFMLSKQYLVLLAISFTIAIPITFILMYQWLSNFAYHISLSWIVFVTPGLLMVMITLLLMSGQSLKTALTNPTESLKHE